jgi:hypothetical protein
MYLTRMVRRGRQGLVILGVVAVAIACVAAYIAVIKLVVDARGGGTSAGPPEQGVAEEIGETPPSPPSFPASDYHQSRFPPHRRPLLGANYTHYAFPNCTFRNTYILAWYHRPAVAQRVHEQLAQMRHARVSTIRTVLWHDATSQPWGPIPSAGGALREPFRSNLRRYVSEVRRFGFARFTLVFEPARTHSPLRTEYEPRKFAENWRLIREARAVVKRYGPPNTRFDLLGEGAPNATPTSYEPRPQQTARYLRNMYRLYVRRYGNRDVTVSAIGSMNRAGATNRVGNLVRILKSSGAPLPRWYDVHIGHEPAGAWYALWHAERQLKAERQSQPLVIGDAGYNNPGVARAVRRFLRRSGRRLQELTPWFRNSAEGEGCPFAPPYSPGAYGAELHSR